MLSGIDRNPRCDGCQLGRNVMTLTFMTNSDSRGLNTELLVSMVMATNLGDATSLPARLRWLAWQEACRLLLEVNAGLFVVIEAADVLPVTIGLERGDVVAVALDRHQQFGHIKLATRWNQVEAAARDDVDPHADLVRDDRFLLIVDEPSVFGRDDDPEIDLDFTPAHRDCCPVTPPVRCVSIRWR